MCAHPHVGSEAEVRKHLQPQFYLKQCSSVSQAKPELTNMASLTNQLGLGMPCLHFQRLESQLGHNTCQHICGFWCSGDLNSDPHA